ncbi:hypothetical protein DY000_02027358 [Brassica cretica]|uniref:FBD domain-containing protein n=1 Tax=Brassica cretica TaxID=69181 RepID=A0ABQ7E2W2_BRACR|nr:hypothetical protein DY000_02027358 [Brassica cretica]
MIYSCEYCHSTRQKVFWPQVFCPKDGVIFGLWFQDSNTTISITIFKQFVHRSFLSNKAPVLAHLHLSLGRDCPSVDIGLWINLALSRHVRVLHIVIPYPKKGPVTLPSSLYTSEKLQRLTLIKCVFLDVPVHVRLPSLKTLSLKLITYADNTSLQRLLSGCPNLEGLSVVVEQCIGDPPVDVNIVMLSLQRLHMYHANIETRGTYVIDVPSLKCLEISDSARCNFRQIENMPELVRARVSFGADSTHKFLKALTSVRRLTLRQPLTKRVHLVLYTFSVGCWDLVTYMLQYSPKLRFLKLIDKLYIGRNVSRRYHSRIDISTGWKTPSSVPECLLHSLEAFEWFGYRGRQEDREMATYVLNNATCLKTATFSPKSTHLGKKHRMLKELASAGSNRVELSLVTTSSYMDIISHLPDDLLLRILSFNTTKDAIPTSLLSKRRRSLWTLAPGLGFEDRNHNDIAQWIHLAVIRHLRELRIETRPSKQVSIALPSTLYTSETLQRMTLINCLLLDVPAHVLIPSLKTLSLKFVTCSVTDKTSLQRLLSGCPNLEELSVEQDLIDFNIVVPSLQRLHMSQQSFESRRLYVLDAPSLKYLKITDTVSWNLRQIENMPELVRAHVNIWGGDSTERFLKALTSVRHLTLSMTTPKLVHLVLCTFSGHCWDLVICMLQDSPKLRFLKLIDDVSGAWHRYPNWLEAAEFCSRVFTAQS